MSKPWQAVVLTLYPEMFPEALGAGVVGKAQESGLWSLETVDIRSFARDKHRSVDDTPAGGGPGMVMRADILGQAVTHVLEKTEKSQPLLYMSPRGKPLTQARVKELAAGPGVSLLCGRFEGIDERVLQARPIEEVSVGDFVLSGGEIAAMALIDASVRLIPGVLGAEASTEEESFEDHLLEYPHYTRPAVWEGLEIPEVLTSGHHGKIEAWRQKQREELTKERRPDLWRKHLKDRRGE
ncbi:MAG: tRNA (guanosine(37)-N1)-methyltransferase TrmD [Alphaproteobacteria bacterium]|nr:MAG: tRNA (guanosine(37)-N1)-methyltransferase TrmD [Alphaproteobacteria bacterium]